MMRLLSYLLLFISSANVALGQHGHQGGNADKPSVHGMVIFGQSKIYASHLPLFHTPHNYQIVLELELSKADKQKFIVDQRMHPEFTTYTIEPERFILPKKIAELGSFKANLFRGHFERGGEKIVDSLTIKIKSVLYFKKFNDTDKSANSLFLLFGNSEEQFAVHQIFHQPDFDQILQVKVDSNTINSINDKCVIISLSEKNVPLGIGGNKVVINVEGKNAELLFLRQLYLEFDDLQE